MRRRSKLALAALLLPLPLLPLGGCADEQEKRPDIVLVIIDTLRADRLGSHGNTRGLTPELDELAAKGYRFEYAQAQAPWTLPSTASLLTSTYPQTHGAGGSVALPDRPGGFTQLNATVDTLAEVLREAGYQTASFVNVDFLGKDFGLKRGFEHVDEKFYNNNEEVRSATETTNRALTWLGARDRDRPVFALVHYFDTHAKYAPPAEYRRRFALPQDRDNDDFQFGSREDMARFRMGQLVIDEQLMERAAALYDGEIAYVDEQVGRLFNGLTSRGLGDAIIVVTSDHGEEFYEHGNFEHGHSLYDEVLHVPLIFSWPGHLEPGSSPGNVALIDVAPTLCQLIDLGTPPSFQGRSLVPTMSGEPHLERRILSHGNLWGPAMNAMTEGPRKVIFTPPQPLAPTQKLELYDRSADPEEQADLSVTQEQEALRMKESMRQLSNEYGKLRGRSLVIDPETRERLEAGGYVGADGGEDQ